MEPEFHSGDEIACRFIVEPSFIQWGRPHVLDTTQESYTIQLTIQPHFLDETRTVFTLPPSV